jgi:hypothetical protein
MSGHGIDDIAAGACLCNDAISDRHIERVEAIEGAIEIVAIGYSWVRREVFKAQVDARAQNDGVRPIEDALRA